MGRAHNFVDLAGKTFGDLIALELDYTKKSRKNPTQRGLYWICKCSCGTIKPISAHHLKRGQCRSCGCKKGNWRYVHNFIGKRFGNLIVIKEGNGKKAGKQILKTALCQCDCGNQREFRVSHIRQGFVKSCGCLCLKNNYEPYRNDQYITKDGYVQFLIPEHPNATKQGYLLEHIYVMSKYLKRPLTNDETVHHKNGLRNDNRIENLELWGSYHTPGQRIEDLLKLAYEIIEKYKNYQNPTVLDYQI